MVMPEGIYFTSLTHGKSPDCRLANAGLRERLEDYKFGNFVLEQNCWKCPNNTCNISFVFILSRSEFYRLKNQVRFDTRPTFLIHNSFTELIKLDERFRLMGVERKEIGIQNVPQMRNVSVDANPSVKVALSQTDFKVGKQDTGIQTEVPIIQLSESTISSKTTESPIRTIETQESDDDDVVFIEMREKQVGPPAIKDVKEEPIDDQDSIVESDSDSSKPDSEDSYQSAQSQSISLIEQPEPVAPEPEIKEEPMEVVSPAPLASVFNTPKSLAHSPADDSNSSMGSSAKRIRLMDVEHCEVCLFMADDNCMSQYCQHVMDIHATIFRFKCNHCAVRFTDSRRAKHHVRAIHGLDAMEGTLYTVEIARDQLMKFMRTASNCYPDKFRGISFDALEETLLSLP